MTGRLRRAWRRLRYGEPIVVVSGLPRSGTSLMMQMLEAGGVEVLTDRHREPDHSNPRGYYELERVKELETGGDTSWLRDARGKAVKIVAYLLSYLPSDHNYRVLFMLRDLDEILASQRRMLERSGQPVDTDDERMRELFTGHLLETSRILTRRAEFGTLYLRHDHVLSDPRREARRVAAFLGRPLDTEAMIQVVDPALHRSRGRS